MREPRKVSITLPLPGPELRGNKRGHTRWTPASYKELKEDTILLFFNAVQDSNWNTPYEPFTQANVLYDYYYFGQAADPDNVVTGMKAALDGAEDCGIIKNDGPRCVVSLSIKAQRAESKEDVRVEMQIAEVLD